MPTSPASRLAGLDTLRAFAIVAVMFFHLSSFFPESFHVFAQFGWAGVDLFFVLSGYLIGSQLLRPLRAGKPLQLIAFFRRRAFRILPAYLVVLVLYLLWPTWREGNGLSPTAEFLTFTLNLLIHYPADSTFSHAWSLCVEEHFYLLLPWLVLLLSRRPSPRKTLVALVAVLLSGIAVRTWILFHLLQPNGSSSDFGSLYIEHIYYPTYTRLDGLLAGVAIALLQTFRPLWWAWLARFAGLIPPLGLALTALALFLFRHRFESVHGEAAASTILGFPLLALGLGLLVTAAAMHGTWISSLRLPGTQTLATIAFSVYLTHKEVAHLLIHFLPDFVDTFPGLVSLLLFPLCFLVGLAFYHAVELPFLRLRDRRVLASPNPDLEARQNPAL